ncbi:MAG: hypothetical protein OXC03_01570 [Flavobacteriaceae bacterium]|nr:hypothetical protein [Flavobacteriaceae bacterium]
MTKSEDLIKKIDLFCDEFEKKLELIWFKEEEKKKWIYEKLDEIKKWKEGHKREKMHERSVLKSLRSHLCCLIAELYISLGSARDNQYDQIHSLIGYVCSLIEDVHFLIIQKKVSIGTGGPTI